MTVVERCITNLKYFLKDIQVDKLAVAVSGGVDSVSLLHIISRWCSDNDTKCIILSVDHNLRPESKSEIEFIRKLANKLGHQILILPWVHGVIEANIQAKARSARYQLMTDACHKLGINNLLVAHHLDDMIETYLMRKARDSSAFGLSSSNSYFVNDVRVIRPLYNIRKSELLNYLHENNIQWCEDESNVSKKYERVRVRQYVATLDSLEKEKIVKEIELNNQNCRVLNKLLIEAIAESLKISNFGYAVLNIRKFLQFDKLIQIQLIFYITTIIGGQGAIPRYRNVHKVLGAIMADRLVKITLHHCVLNKDGECIFIYKERRYIEKTLSLQASDDLLLWDNRFQITCPSLCAQNHHISILDNKECKKIIESCDLTEFTNCSKKIYKEILLTIPVIKNLEKIVAIPHISHYDGDALENNVQIMFKPKFISRFTHFI